MPQGVADLRPPAVTEYKTQDSMTRFDKRSIAKNVGSSWLGLGVTVATGFFLSPFILHRLGDDAFGLWTLVFAITGYYGLFDFGIRSSVIRYVAKFSAVDDREELHRLINTSLFSYSCVAVVLLAVTALGTVYVDKLFHVQPAFMRTAQILFAMVGASLALGFPFAVFAGTLEGLQKFHLLNGVNILNTLLRAVLIVFALKHGYGLLTVALITVLLPLLGGIINALSVFRLVGLRIGPGLVSKSTFRQIANYGSITFMISVAYRLRFKTDAVVIGTFLSAAQITYFTIGSRLVDYAGDVVSSLAQIFVPMSSQSHATGDLGALRKIFVAGNRACALVIFPIAAMLAALGKSAIEAWVGQRYVERSYPVLLILLVPSTLMLAQSASGRILYGMAKHKTWGWIVLAEGVANLILSILLVRPYGIVGDALGTAIPLTCSMLFFLPGHLCRLLGIRLWTYVTEAFLLPLGLCIPLVASLLWMRHWFVPHNYIQLLVQLFIGSAVYGAGLVWAIRTRRIWNVGTLSSETVTNEVAASLVETYQEEQV
jgi:O-antigen/teichoic acid export membrane protein